MSFSVVTYNILADAYIKPERYPEVSAQVLDPHYRGRALRLEIEALDADILCLQEVEPAFFESITTQLQSHGYVGHYAQKGRGRADGCATFVRRERFELQGWEALHYADGEGRGGASGHVALIHYLRAAAGDLAIANTHLRWDPPGQAPETRWAVAQVSELVRYTKAQSASEWVLCGDFNVTPDDAVLALFVDAGFQLVHGEAALQHTCYANGRSETLDYLFYAGSLSALGCGVAAIDSQTPLPSAQHPSDHVPLRGEFEF